MNRTLFALATSVLLAGALGVSCGDNEPDDSNPGASGGSNPGTGGMGQGGDGGGGSVCHPSQTLCGEFCASTASDPLNCGTCDATCGVQEACVDGMCEIIEQCSTGQVLCDDACTDRLTDREHCGACGTACESGEVCDNGLCATSCSEGRIDCGGGCIDPMTDRLYCGATDCDAAAGGAGGAPGGESCADGEVCTDGSCTNSCPLGQIVCDNRCITPASDRDFCGATDCSDESTNGETCATGEACSEGFCSTSCPSGQVVCGGACIDPETDRRYCGATDCSDESTNGEVCADSKVCSEGACENSCADGYIVCNDTCIDPLSNNQFCGATDCSQPTSSGTPCGTEQSCQIGQCRTFLFDWSLGVQINSDGDATQNGQVIGTDSDGNTLVVWKQYAPGSSDNATLRLYSRRYLFATKTWTPVIPVDLTVDEQARNQQLAVAANGDAYVVWDTNGEIFGAAYDGATNLWSDAERLDDAVGVTVRESPTVAVDAAGNAWIAWSERVNAAPVRFRIVRSYYDRGADSLSLPEVVDGYGENDSQKSFLPRLVMNDVGDAALVWRDQDEADGVFWRSRVIATVKLSEEVNWTTPTELTAGPRIHYDFGAPDVGIDSEGDAYVVWADTVTPESAEADFDSNIAIRKIAGGTPGAMTVIESIPGRLRRPRIATDDAGKSVVTYFHGDYTYAAAGPYTVYATRVPSDLGTPITAELRVIPDASGSDQTNPTVVLDGAGNSHVSWVVSNGAETSAFNATVGSWGAYEDLTAPSVGTPGTGPSMSAADGGRAFAVWYQNGDTYFARYD